MRSYWLAGVWICALAAGLFFVFNQALLNEEPAVAAFSQLSAVEKEQEIQQVREFNGALQEEGELYDQFTKELNDRGFAPYRIRGTAYSTDHMELTIYLYDHIVNEKQETELQSLFSELIIRNGLTPERFKLTVQK
ncbi:hypothetical protein [Jeotgalibacillus proteolyticus]|uniref:Uncharacterized protein n=1 Tax=Jeotgalibacillus proteolyticus TaxID=2082395 RepID=A0A2S5GCX7_9BACL|nr:hypothetical protein [Jeotgalibacillus proteolyticus]PPA70856.1 hypothetical protein C4B60_08695 [Jeotgalibacillus proteolyticus]